jgi:hypothetical protein
LADIGLSDDVLLSGGLIETFAAIEVSHGGDYLVATGSKFNGGEQADTAGTASENGNFFVQVSS